MSTQNSTTTSMKRKTRVALMGEFSSGKSTLSNLLLGEEPLPMKITATRLPPVLISYGEPATFVVAKDGSEKEIDPQAIEDICLEETQMIRLHRQADILQICDLIDTPGISDPNMSMESWRPIVDDVDCIVWCTHATQAWRQSEAAMWEQISTNSRGNDILLVTQFDKMRTKFEGERVLSRLWNQTQGQFKAIYPVSLIQAIEASDDFSVWQKSGAAQFIEFLVPHLLQITEQRAEQQPGFQRHAANLSREMVVEHVAEVVEAPQSMGMQNHDQISEDSANVIRPKRVRIKTRIKPRTPRPEGSEADPEQRLRMTMREPLGESDSGDMPENEQLDATG